MDTDPVNPKALRFMMRLVTVLTATMIVGMVTVIALLVIRLQAAPRVALPANLSVGGGSPPVAFTRGPDWLAVATEAQILIYTLDGELRQTIDIAP